MKYDCSDEFDLDLIYLKLTSKSHCVNTVKACNFFTRKSELEMLQEKMAEISKLKRQKQNV